MHERTKFGNAAENIAEAFLVAKGLRLCARQYRCRFGEVDLVMQDGSETVFVEVKARHSNEYGYPEEAVTAQKIRKLHIAAYAYMNEHHLPETTSVRLDVVAISYNQKNQEPEIVHFIAIGA